MLTYYCPHCWAIVSETDTVCPACGYELEQFQQLPFEEKLLGALHHAVSERQIMAAQILGNIHSPRALVEFEKIIDGGEENYYLLRAILLATAKINHPDRMKILLKATHNPSELVSRLAKELLERLEQNHEPDPWDHHTG